MDVLQTLRYARSRSPKFVSELKEFVRFPSVSSQPERAGDIKRCARWLAKHLQQIGLKHVRIIPTRGNPIVYASWQRAPGRPTLIIYGHYDVLPGEPIREWHTPPFTRASRTTISARVAPLTTKASFSLTSRRSSLT
jgi:acetylornithine deacetylase/succinyl-diaminopimelate desuccinylase-like protein